MQSTLKCAGSSARRLPAQQPLRTPPLIAVRFRPVTRHLRASPPWSWAIIESNSHPEAIRQLYLAALKLFWTLNKYDIDTFGYWQFGSLGDSLDRISNMVFASCGYPRPIFSTHFKFMAHLLVPQLPWKSELTIVTFAQKQDLCCWNLQRNMVSQQKIVLLLTMVLNRKYCSDWSKWSILLFIFWVLFESFL